MSLLRSELSVSDGRAYRPNLYKSIAFIIGMEKTNSIKGQVMILVEKNLSHLHQIPSMIFLDQKLKLKQYTSIFRVSTSVQAIYVTSILNIIYNFFSNLFLYDITILIYLFISNTQHKHSFYGCFILEF